MNYAIQRKADVSLNESDSLMGPMFSFGRRTRSYESLQRPPAFESCTRSSDLRWGDATDADPAPGEAEDQGVPMGDVRLVVGEPVGFDSDSRRGGVRAASGCRQHLERLRELRLRLGEGMPAIRTSGAIQRGELRAS